MAEFQEVMRQITRYCNEQEDCAECKLNKIVGDFCPSDLFVSDKGAEIENEILAWAAEHPEPVYPTVYEWLVSIGLLSSDMWSASDLNKPIPVDTAEKLGIEPKEG